MLRQMTPYALCVQKEQVPPTPTQPRCVLNAQLGTTRVKWVLIPAPNVLQGRALVLEPPNALSVPKGRLVKRDNFASHAQHTLMLKTRGRLSAYHAMPRRVPRREPIGVTNVLPELLLKAFLGPASRASKTIILLRTQKIARAVHLVTLPHQVHLNA
jgi:hypothetical protein